MQVTKQQIVTGIVQYSKNEMIPKISDKAFKIIVTAAVTMLETNPEIITRFLDDPMISSLLMGKDGFYEVETFGDVLERTLEQYGDFPVKIPGIKFISPGEKELSFSASDISKLKTYITGGTA